jgi:hypothetical protein
VPDSLKNETLDPECRAALVKAVTPPAALGDVALLLPGECNIPLCEPPSLAVLRPRRVAMGARWWGGRGIGGGGGRTGGGGAVYCTDGREECWGTATLLRLLLVLLSAGITFEGADSDTGSPAWLAAAPM